MGVFRRGSFPQGGVFWGEVFCGEKSPGGLFRGGVFRRGIFRERLSLGGTFPATVCNVCVYCVCCSMFLFQYEHYSLQTVTYPACFWIEDLSRNRLAKRTFPGGDFSAGGTFPWGGVLSLLGGEFSGGSLSGRDFSAFHIIINISRARLLIYNFSTNSFALSLPEEFFDLI